MLIELLRQGLGAGLLLAAALLISEAIQYGLNRKRSNEHAKF